MNRRHVEYDLYFDESGDFTETSSESAERASSSTRRHRAASQYVGLLAKRGSLNPQSAGDILRELEKIAGRKLNHATDLKNRKLVQRLVEALVHKIEAHGWQVVRLVNAEGVQFGDRVNTTITMAAELVVRVLRQKELEGQSHVALRIVPAGVKLSENEDGEPVLIEDWEYEARLRDAIGYINVRRGYAYESSNWIIDEIRMGSGKKWPELILCDLLSNTTYAEFGRLDPATRELLENALGAYSFTLAVRQLFERVDALVQQQFYGEAIMVLSDRLVADHKDSDIRSQVQAKLADVVQRLGRLSARARDPQLQQLTAWLEHIIYGQRALNTGLAVVRLLQNDVEQPLGEAIGQENAELLAWFRYALSFWGLTACNHSGLLADGARHAEAIEQSAGLLARQWEHTSLMARGLIARAVHMTDCFEFDAAARSMEKLVQCDEAVADLFADEMFGPGEHVHSDIRAQALGTWLQAEMLAGLSDPPRLARARQLSEQALREFTDPADHSRQCQYRCQIEVAGGEWREAMKFLGRALGVSQPTHGKIGRAIQALAAASPLAEGFPLLHWLRLGTAATLGNHAGGDEFLQALEDIGFFQSPWVRGEITRYPAHGILRRAALLQAVQHRYQRAQDALTTMRKKLAPVEQRQLVLGLVYVVAVAEVAAVMWAQEPAAAMQMLNPTKSRGVKLSRVVGRLQEQSRDRFSRFPTMLDDWSQTLDDILHAKMPADEVPAKIRTLARPVDF